MPGGHAGHERGNGANSKLQKANRVNNLKEIRHSFLHLCLITTRKRGSSQGTRHSWWTRVRADRGVQPARKPHEVVSHFDMKKGGIETSSNQLYMPSLSRPASRDGDRLALGVSGVSIRDPSLLPQNTGAIPAKQLCRSQRSTETPSTA